MFATATPTRMHAPFSAANAYARVGVETGVTAADPHHLVQMLFDGLLDSLAQARGAIRERQVQAKTEAISKALRIVNEGLRAGLNLAEGGRLAADLNELYGYVTLRLTQGNATNDEAALEECRRLIEPLREAWRAIAPGANTTTTKSL